MRNGAMLYDAVAIEGPSTTYWWFLVMFKNLVAMPEIVEYRMIITRRRATYIYTINMLSLDHIKLRCIAMGQDPRYTYHCIIILRCYNPSFVVTLEKMGLRRS